MVWQSLPVQMNRYNARGWKLRFFARDKKRNTVLCISYRDGYNVIYKETICAKKFLKTPLHN